MKFSQDWVLCCAAPHSPEAKDACVEYIKKHNLSSEDVALLETKNDAGEKTSYLVKVRKGREVKLKDEREPDTAARPA